MNIVFRYQQLYDYDDSIMKLSALLIAGMAAVLGEASRTDNNVGIKPTERDDVSVRVAQVPSTLHFERPSENSKEGLKANKEPKPNTAAKPPGKPLIWYLLR